MEDITVKDLYINILIFGLKRPLGGPKLDRQPTYLPFGVLHSFSVLLANQDFSNTNYAK